MREILACRIARGCWTIHPCRSSSPEPAASPTRSGSASSTLKSIPRTRCCATIPGISRRSRSTTLSTACPPRRCSRAGPKRSRRASRLRSRPRAASPTRSGCARPNRTWRNSCGAHRRWAASSALSSFSCRPTSGRTCRGSKLFSGRSRPTGGLPSSSATNPGRTRRSTRRCARRARCSAIPTPTRAIRRPWSRPPIAVTCACGARTTMMRSWATGPAGSQPCPSSASMCTSCTRTTPWARCSPASFWTFGNSENERNGCRPGADRAPQALLREERAEDRGPLLHLRLCLRYRHGRPRRLLARDRPAGLLSRRDPGGTHADVLGGRAASARSRGPVLPQALVLPVPHRARALLPGHAAQRLHYLFLQELLAPRVVRLSRVFGFLAVGQRVRALHVAGPHLQVRPARTVRDVLRGQRRADRRRLDRDNGVPCLDARRLRARGRRRLVDQEEEAGSFPPRAQADARAPGKRADRVSGVLLLQADPACAAVDPLHRHLSRRREVAGYLPLEPREAGVAHLAPRGPGVPRPARGQGVRVLPHLLAHALLRPGAGALVLEGRRPRVGLAGHDSHQDPRRARRRLPRLRLQVELPAGRLESAGRDHRRARNRPRVFPTRNTPRVAAEFRNRPRVAAAPGRGRSIERRQ